MTGTYGDFRRLLTTRFRDVLSHGTHEANSKACALEARNAALGLDWSDSPGDYLDLRSLNDGPWRSDQARTEALLPVLRATWDWPSWSPERQQRWAAAVALRTVKEVLPVALRACGLEAEAAASEQAPTLAAAFAAMSAVSTALSARSAEAWSVAWSARSAANAMGAVSAARSAVSTALSARSAARSAESTEVLSLACRIWTEGAV